jgi:adenylate cyclase
VFGQLIQTGSNAGEQMKRGLLSAFAELNSRGGYSGRQIQLRVLYYNDIDSSLDKALTWLVKDTTVGVVGMTNTTVIEYALPTLVTNSIPLIGASTGSALLHQAFQQHIVNIRPSFDDEVGSIVEYLVNQRVIRRISIIYQNISMGVGVKTSFGKVMTSLGLNAYSTDIFNTDVSGPCIRLPSDTEAVIIATDLPSQVGALATCLQSTKVLVVTLSNIDSGELAAALPAGGKVYASQVVPNTNDTSIALTTLLRNSFSVSYPGIFPTSMAVEGYVTGKTITSVLTSMADNKVKLVTPSTFISELYLTSLITSGGFQLGPYVASSCSLVLAQNGTNTTSTASYNTASSTCCNAGIRQISVSLVYSYGTMVTQSSSTTSFTGCYLDLTGLTLPIIFGQTVSGVSTIGSATYRFAAGVNAALNEINVKGGIQKRRVVLYSLDNSGDSLQLSNQLQYLTQRIPTLSLVGQDRNDTLSLSSSLPLIGTRSGDISLRAPYKRNYINVRPSVIDEAAATATTLYTKLQLSNVIIVNQDTDYWNQARDAFRAYATQLLSASSPSVISFTPATLNSVTVSGTVGVALFADAQYAVTVATNILQANTNAIVVMLSELGDISSIATRFSNRLYVVQPIPQFNIDQITLALTQTASNSTVATYLQSFMTSMNVTSNVQFCDSTSLEGYFVGRMITAALGDIIGEISSSSIIDSFYTKTFFFVDGFKLGPIGSDCGTSSSPYCGCNQMMHQTSVLAAGTLVSPSYNGAPLYGAVELNDYLFSFSTCGVVFPIYTFPSYLIIVIIACIVVVMAIISIILGIIAWRYRVHRLIRYAPNTGQMVLAFTDVQNSTKLWNTKPQEMKAALKIHNTIMRRLINKYRGYEVKTQGDSFMVCFSDPMDAVRWACCVQRELLQAEWPAGILDAFDCRVEWDSTRSLIYRGLRVRIGLHYGEAERNQDTVTRRFDYFGNTVNTAARVESEAKGGQVFISEDLFNTVKFFLLDAKLLTGPTQLAVEPALVSEAPPSVFVSEPEQQETGVVRRFSSPMNDSPQNDTGLNKYLVQENGNDTLIADRMVLDHTETEEEIFYRLAGSFSLKGLQDKVNIYELVSSSLHERKYDDTKKEEAELLERQSSMRSRSGSRASGKGSFIVNADSFARRLSGSVSDRRSSVVASPTSPIGRIFASKVVPT